jgi:hypothetical protein
MTGAARIIVGLLLVLLPGVVSIATGAGVIAVGEPFPAQLFPSLQDGGALSVTSFRGQKLVLHIFASW